MCFIVNAKNTITAHQMLHKERTELTGTVMKNYFFSLFKKNNNKFIEVDPPKHKAGGYIFFSCTPATFSVASALSHCVC